MPTATIEDAAMLSPADIREIPPAPRPQGRVRSPFCRAAGLGLVFHYWRTIDPHVVKAWRLWAFGVLVHLIVLVMFLWLPGDPLRTTIPVIAGPILVFYPLGVVLIGSLVALTVGWVLVSIAAALGPRTPWTVSG